MRTLRKWNEAESIQRLLRRKKTDPRTSLVSIYSIVEPCDEIWFPVNERHHIQKLEIYSLIMMLSKN